MTRVAVFGAGAIGTFLGGVLAHAGHEVTLIGREHAMESLTQAGALRLTDYRGLDIRVSLPELTTSPEALGQAELILLTVKCLGVHEAAQYLRAWAPSTATVLCLQNGLGSEQSLQGLPQTIVRGIFGANIAPQGPGHFHRGTEGDVWTEPYADVAGLNHAFQQAHFALQQTHRYEALAWAKLQLNLNNAINALSDLPLKAELEQRDYRRVLAAAMNELIAITDCYQLRLPRLTKLPARWIPRLLTIPDGWFKRLAGSMLAIDPQARSSMWEDLNQQRMTEVPYINGAVVEAGRHLGIPTPVNAWLVEQIEAVERRHQLPGISAKEMLREIRQRQRTKP